VKNKEYYLDLDYEIIVRKVSDTEGGGYFAYYKDYKGVMGDGDTVAEAMDDVKSAFACFVEDALANNEEIKEPSHLQRSKRINITMPQNLLEVIDNYAKDHNLNRSSFLQLASKQYMGLSI
jgi:predicted RNase H-like HicB family nuclease